MFSGDSKFCRLNRKNTGRVLGDGGDRTNWWLKPQYKALYVTTGVQTEFKSLRDPFRLGKKTKNKTKNPMAHSQPPPFTFQ